MSDQESPDVEPPHVRAADRLAMQASGQAPEVPRRQPAPVTPEEAPNFPETPVPVQALMSPEHVRFWLFGSAKPTKRVTVGSGIISLDLDVWDVQVTETAVVVLYDSNLARMRFAAGATDKPIAVHVGNASYDCVFLGGTVDIPKVGVTMLSFCRYNEKES